MFQLMVIASLVGFSLQACDPSTCILPNCRCFNDPIAPGGLPKSEVPQIVMVSFEGAINYTNINDYRPIFASVYNPNNCPARGTFFIQDEGTEYRLISALRIEGHEIGIQSVNGKAPTNSTGWIDTIRRVRDQLGDVGVNLTEVNGVRAPGLAHGGTEELIGLASNKMLYDSSCANVDFSEAETFLWPYTFDDMPTEPCDNGKTTDRPFPGKWEVPVADLHDTTGGKLPCAVPSACRNITTKNDAFNLIHSAFMDHYNGKRTPFLLVLDHSWAVDKNKRDGTTEFLQYIRVIYGDDVWIVPISKALQWIQSPVPIAELMDFAPWQCS